MVPGTQFAANPDDPLSYFPGVQAQKPYSILRLNAIYALGYNLYLDSAMLLVSVKTGIQGLYILINGNIRWTQPALDMHLIYGSPVR